MNWITIVWSMIASACLTLAALHVLIGARLRSRSQLLFAGSAVCAAAIAFFEVTMMRSPSAERQGELLRVVHVPLTLLFVFLVLFVRSYLRAGRAWLGAAAIATRLVLLAVNFAVVPNANFTRMTGVRVLVLPLGESIYVAQGSLRAWTRLGQFSSLLFLLFMADAIRTVWKRGERRQAAVIGGSVAAFAIIAAGDAALVMQGAVATPYLISAAYLTIVAAMSYELTSDVVRSAELSRRLSTSEAALDESERRMSLAAEAADVGVWSYDVPRDEMWVNDRVLERRGLSPENRTLRFEDFVDAVHPDDRLGLRGAVEDAIRTIGQFEREYRILRHDGERRWIYAGGRAERLAGGRVVVRGASLDVTRRKEAELEAARQRDELAHLSRVTLLGELSGSLAHELNQPLTAILSNAQAALRFLDDGGRNLEEIRAILADIVAEDKHAGEVIRRLRLLMKKGEVHLQPMDISEVADEVMRLVRSDLVRQGVEATAELPSGLPPALGDRVQIQQVILNLVANACDAMKSAANPADRRIVVRAERGDGAGVRVSVSDLGDGISAAAADRIFEPFFTTKSDGMGLGLAVCRTIIAAHGGTLWATPNPDRGSTFSFTLPAAGGVS